MALVRSGGGSEKVTIDGVPVKKRINLISIAAKKEKATTPGNVTKAFILKNKLYVCISNQLYVFNSILKTFTFLTNAPTQYIFCNQNGIFCGKLVYNPQSNFAYFHMYLYEYNFEKNAFTEIQRMESIHAAKSEYKALFYGYGNYSGGCLTYQDMDYRKTSRTIGNVFSYSADTGYGIARLPAEANCSLKVRCIEYNFKSYLNKGICSADNGDKQFTIYENGWRKEYTATNDFINTYQNGSLAIVDGKLWMYGTDASGTTKRIQWNGSTYTNEEIIVRNSKIFNINNTAPFEFEEEIIFVGQNEIFVLGKNYSEE